jgi:acyl-CoA hydrolase
MKGKSPKASQVEMIQQVRPGDTNPLGTVFGGQVMAWIDVAGAVTAMRHVRGPVVTASFDRVDFHAPAKVGHVMVLKAQVNYTGRTSLEIGVTVNAENPMTGECHLTTEALITFVHLDQIGKPAKVPPVIPETEEEKRRYEAGKHRREMRKG